MWCKNCNMETNEKTCHICGEDTIEDLPVEIYWCSHCRTPIIQVAKQADKGICPLCKSKTKYMTADLRPVFPQERLLLEILLEKKPHEFREKSVWASDSRYYIDGKSISISSKTFQDADADAIAEILKVEEPNNTYDFFNSHIATFIEANKNRLHYLIDEAHRFVKHAASKFDEEHIVVSFSGGKDSTVTADVVTKALSNPELTHIFGNTTLEFPYTIQYAQRFNEAHEQCFWIAKNNEQDFYDVCEDIGPPARMMRWCCSMFKTGPITRIINKLYRDSRILTFYGIRKSESVSRSKYNRIEDDAESVKIQQQTVASPIFFWKDLDIWLYILAEEIDFNDAYRLGYDRVGCWCCPNNNQRAQFLSRIYMPEQSKKWRDFLISFAEKIGKPDGDDYVEPQYTGMEERTYYHNISDEIDRISFELELEDTDDEEQFSFEDDLDDDDNDDIFDDYDEDIDPAIFDDPTLMVKWLEQQEKQNTVFVEGSQRHKQEHLEAERREQERLEAERQGQERLEAIRREQERLEAERREQERLEAERREQERLEVERREQERIEKDRQDLFNRLEQEHLQKLKKLEEQHRSKKQSLGKQLSQIEGLQKEKEARLTKLTFLQFLEKRTLAAELMDLDKQKRELLALIQTAESDYVTMRDQEHMNFNLLLVEKGL